METNIAVFRGKEIRKTIHNNEWWFVVEDVVLALIDSKDSKQYIQRMKQRDQELSKGWVQIVHTLIKGGDNLYPLWKGWWQIAIPLGWKFRGDYTH